MFLRLNSWIPQIDGDFLVANLTWKRQHPPIPTLRRNLETELARWQLRLAKWMKYVNNFTLHIYIYNIYTYTFFRRKQKCCVSFKLSRFSVSFKLDAASTSPVNSDLVIHVDGQAIPPTNANAPSVYIHIIRAKLKKKALHLGESANFRTHVLRCPWGHTQAVDLCCWSRRFESPMVEDTNL